MVAEGADLCAVDHDALCDARGCRGIHEHVIALVRFPCLMAPEGLDFSTMYGPVTVAKVARCKIVEEPREPLPALNVVKVPRSVQVSAHDEGTTSDSRRQLLDQRAQMLSVVGRTNMNTDE